MKKIQVLFCFLFVWQLGFSQTEYKDYDSFLLENYYKNESKKLSLRVLHLEQRSEVNRYLLRSTLSSSGKSKEIKVDNKTYFIQQSIGQESVIGTYANGDKLIIQGFIQGDFYENSTNSIKMTELKANFYPNPVKQSITAHFDDIISHALYVSIYDQAGKRVIYKKYPVSQQLSINTQGLLPGSYFLKISSNNKIFVGKLIKE